MKSFKMLLTNIFSCGIIIYKQLSIALNKSEHFERVLLSPCPVPGHTGLTTGGDSKALFFKGVKHERNKKQIY